MSCPEYEDRLNDYAGGYLSGRARQEVDEHLLVCTACRDEARSIAELLGELTELPRAIEAPEEIWVATSDAIRSGRKGHIAAGEAKPGRPVRMEPSRLALFWAPLATAAAALVVAAAALYLALSQPSQAPPAAGRALAESDAATDGTAQVALSDIVATEAEFNRAATELLAALEARRGEYPPRTLAVIEKNLEAINEAIVEIRGAMESDPDNASLGRLMRAMYHRKMQVLQGSVVLPAS